MDWEKAEHRNDQGTVEGIVFNRIKEIIAVRKANDVFASTLHSIPVDTGNKGVFGFHKEDRMLVLANFTEKEQVVDCNRVNWFGLPWEMHDLIQGKSVRLWENIVLGPYEYLWLV